MTSLDIGFALLCAALGFGGVYYMLPSKSTRSKIKENSRSDKKPHDESKKEESDTWYSILGVLHDDNMDTITAAYHRLIAKYHPDKLSGLGAEFSELAEKRAKAINWAYQEAKRQSKPKYH